MRKKKLLKLMKRWDHWQIWREKCDCQFRDTLKGTHAKDCLLRAILEAIGEEAYGDEFN